MIVPASIPAGSKLLIIGQAPGKVEAERGYPFAGRDGQQLREWLRRVDLDPASVAYDNVHQDFNGDPTYKPTDKEARVGYDRLRELIAEHPEFSVVLLLGGPAAHLVFKGNMTSMTGRQETIDSVTYITTFHPGYYRNAYRNGTLKQAQEIEHEIMGVLMRVADLLRGGSTGVVLPEGRWVGPYTFLPLNNWQALDVETCGDTKDCRRAEFICAAWAPNRMMTLDIPRVLNDSHLVVHNVPYDGVVLGQWDGRWEDTKMLLHMMGEPDTTLKGAALRYLDKPMMSYPEALRLGVLPEYCLDDAITTAALYPVLRDCMSTSVLKLYDDLEAPLNALWIKMTLEGSFYLDHAGLQNYYREQSDAARELEDGLALPIRRDLVICEKCGLWAEEKEVGQKCLEGSKHKWAEHLDMATFANLRSPTQLKAGLESMGIRVPDTSAETLIDYDSYPLIARLLRWKKLVKEISTYLEPWLTIPEGERLGTIWNPHGAWTMRISSRGPNLTNVPNPLWRFFHGGEGHTLLSFDHSQLELRLAAHFSQDPVMLEAFRSGSDMHSMTMAKLGITERRLAKVFNFGALYDTHGTGAGFQQNAKKFGVKLGWDQITEAQRDMRYMIPDYFRWQQETMHKRAIPGLFGMIHIVPAGGHEGHQENEAVNAPIQGGGALVTKYGMLRLHEAGYEVVCQVHDSITVRVPDRDVEEAKHDIPRIMETAIPEPLSVPLVVDVK